MAPDPIFEHEIAFEPANAAEALRALPQANGVVALFGHGTTDRPHLMKAANIRRRLQRLLEPAEGQTKRLNLRDRIARIAWRTTASEFESLLLLHRAMSLAFGTEEARKRMRLAPPYTVRFAAENAYPRIYVTNHLRRRSLGTTFGPFSSRFAAERCCEAIEELFLIRRCYMELHPSPDDPGCIYGEMKKCMAPCQQRCSDEQYSAECTQVLAFLQTQGASRIAELEAERDRASADMMFEEAAAAHAKVAKVKAAAALIDELVQPLSELRAALLMPCPSADGEPHAAVFLFQDGCLHGPERVSLLGVRLAKEQAEVGSSLFAQPLMLAPQPLAPGPLDGGASSETEASPASSSASAEERMLAAIAKLEDGSSARDVAELGDHLALLKRWYYRPERQRVGAIFFRQRDAWPVRRMIRAAAKIAAPEPQKELPSPLPPELSS